MSRPVTTALDMTGHKVANLADATVSGDALHYGQITLCGAELTVSAIGADQDNYTPSGYDATTGVIRQAANIDVTITGITGGTTGRVLFFVNSNLFGSARSTVTLAHNTTSTNLNRFFISNGRNLLLRPAQGAILVYSSISRWTVFGFELGTTISQVDGELLVRANLALLQ